MEESTVFIEYLGENNFIFETIEGHESGDNLGSFDEKPNISCLGTFKLDKKPDFTTFSVYFFTQEIYRHLFT